MSRTVTRKISGMRRYLRYIRCDLSKDDRPGRSPDHQDAEHEPEVADAVRDECFLRGIGSGVALEPMTDEQI